jgi:hypothetical protein
VLLFVVPGSMATVWPWDLTPLTGRVMSAWFTGLGLVFGVAAWSNDRLRLRAPVAGLIAFGVLQGLALLRHGADASGAALGVWTAFLGLCVLVGLMGLRSVWAEDPARLGTTA